MSNNFLATLGPEGLRQKVLEVAKEYLFRAWELAGILYEVKETEIYKAWGFDSFNSYVEDEVRVGRRSVNQYIANYKTFRIELGVDQTNLKDLEVTKAREIGRVVNAENVDEWIEKAKSCSRRELISEIKRSKDRRDGSEISDLDDLTNGDCVPIFKHVTFALDVEQYETWEVAKKKLQRICASDSESWWFDLLCQSFLQEADSRISSLQKQLSWLSRVYGVNVFAVDTNVSGIEFMEKLGNFLGQMNDTLPDNCFVLSFPKGASQDELQEIISRHVQGIMNELTDEGLEEESMLAHDRF